MPRQHLEQDDPDRVEIGPAVAGLSVYELLWCSVLAYAETLPFLGRAREAGLVLEAHTEREVDEDGPVARNEDVVRLNVAMKDVLVMKNIEGAKELFGQLAGRTNLQAFLFLKALIEASTGDELHHHVWDLAASVGFDLSNRDDVG